MTPGHCLVLKVFDIIYRVKRVDCIFHKSATVQISSYLSERGIRGLEMKTRPLSSDITDRPQKWQVTQTKQTSVFFLTKRRNENKIAPT